MRSTWNKLAALLLAVSLLGGGAIAAEAAVNPSTSLTASRPAAQQTSDATSNDAQPCQDEQADDQSEADNGEEGDSAEANQSEADNGDENGAAGESESAAAPGELSEGQDLLTQAKVTVEEAVATAQGAATGSLGSVELKQRDGSLAFEVMIGDQDVLVDATTGAVAGVEPAQNNENECEDSEATVAAGTLDDGAELLPQAGIKLDVAIAAAQQAASGPVGEVDLEEDNGTLVFNVDVGDQDVKVNAQDGTVIRTESDD